MGSLVTFKSPILTDVAVNGTFTVPYPNGYSSVSLANAGDGYLALNDNEVFRQGVGVQFTFGASNITVQNTSPLVWPAGTVVNIGLSRTNPRGSYNLFFGNRPSEAAPGQGGGAVQPSLYLGPVTNGRTRMNDQYTTSNKQHMARSYHDLVDDVTALQIVWWSGYLNGVTETGAGTATLTASILNAALDTRVQVTFDAGAPSKSAGANALIFSDFVPYTAAKGLRIFIDNWWNGASGIPFTNMVDFSNGEGAISGASVPDTTMSAWTPTNAGTMRPIAILGMTRKGTVLIWGDSRSVGTTASSISTIQQGVRVGEIMPSLPNVGAIHLGRFGDRLNGIVASNTIRRQLLQYVTNAIIQCGINDVSNGQTLAQMQTNTATMKGWHDALSIKTWLTTKPTEATSTDLFKLPANQTPFAQFQVMVDYNAWARSAPAGYAGYFEINGPVSTPGDETRWITNGVTNNYATSDGIHEVAAAYALIAASGNINENLLLART